MDIQSSSLSPRIAFYPCCANDIVEPRRLLSGMVEKIVYCDLRKPRDFVRESSICTFPKIQFKRGDVRSHIDSQRLIHVLFYRRDGTGEGGSGIYILGRKWLGRILKHFPERGGLIITDGSNSGNRIFKRMIRPNGYTRKQWRCHFNPCAEQKWLETHGLYTIEVKKIA